MLVLVTTEDDLRRCAQSGPALARAVLKRAQEVAEQVLGSRDQARRDARRRADNLTREGRHAAAEVLGTIRREFLVLLEDLEHLERTLRGADGQAPEAPPAEAEKPGPSGRPRTSRPASSRPASSRPASTTRSRASKVAGAEGTPASRRGARTSTEGRGR
jgi:hypothetical protein